MKKWIMAMLCMAAASAIMSGCAASTRGTTATAAPAATHTPVPAMTAVPSAPAATMAPADDTLPGSMMQATSAPASAGASSMTPAQAGRLAEQVSEAVERISEIDDAETIVRDDRVLIAVEFNDQYKAGLDERMKETIAQAVQKVDDGLTDIRITDNDTLYGQAKSLAERVGNATGLDELADDFTDLWDRVTGM